MQQTWKRKERVAPKKHQPIAHRARSCAMNSPICNENGYWNFALHAFFSHVPVNASRAITNPDLQVGHQWFDHVEHPDDLPAPRERIDA